MTDSRALAIVQHTDPDTGWWLKTKEQATILLSSGFLPKSITKPEQAITIMLKGFELGLPRLYALSNIAIVQGKPTVSAEAMLALVSRDYGKQAFRVKESSNRACTVEWRLEGWAGISEYTFTIDDAATAGLAGSDTWRKYPAAMLRARAISAGIRMAYPECIAGMYVPGELGEPTIVTDEGVVLSAEMSELADPSGELPPPEVDTRTPAQKSGVTLIHEAMAERGYDDPNDREELHRASRRVARHFWPQINSLTDLTATMATDLAAEIRDLSDADLALRATDWIAEINDASMDDLMNIVKIFGELGISKTTHPDYAAAWLARSNSLAREEAA